MRLIRSFWLALLFAAAPAFASGPLKAVPAKLDPAKAYALVEVLNHDEGKVAGRIFLARYDAQGGDVRGGLRSPGSKLPKGESVRVATSKPLIKGKTSRLYLLELDPDTWVIEGAGGTAFSLGSRHFTVAAGDIVDLGVMAPRGDYPEGEGPWKLTVGKVAKMAMLGPFAKGPKPVVAMLDMRERSAADMTLPAPLRDRAVPAAYTPGAKFGNYLGGLVNRLEGRKGRPGPTAEVEAAAIEAAPADSPAPQR
jgi:hypothetical protein